VSRKIIGLDEQQRLVVSPRRAMQMLDCGRTHLYDLLKGELVSCLDGRSRKITVESIHRYIERRLTQHGSKSTVPPHRSRGRPCKDSGPELAS
jgi:hypothetical protein